MRLPLRSSALIPLVSIAAGVLIVLTSNCSDNQTTPEKVEQAVEKFGSGFNVVLVVIDTLRADQLPPYGAPDSQAPYIGELAKGGAVFERAIAASSWTAPSSASIFTSTYPIQHGVLMGMEHSKKRRIKLNRIPDAAETLPEMMRSAGFKTFAVTDNPNIGEQMGFDSGFDLFDVGSNRGADQVNRVVDGWQEQINESDRYFLYLHYMDPHEKYVVRDEWDPGPIEDAHMQRINQAGGERPDPDRVRSYLRSYASEIRYVDRHLEELHRKFNWNENTLVIITADHGEGFGDHKVWGHRVRTGTYQEVVWVPLLFYFPGHIKPKRYAETVSTLDLLPTLRSVVGVAASAQDEGADLSNVLTGNTTPDSNRTIFTMRYLLKRETQWSRLAALKGPWKYVSDSKTGDSLYNTQSDPLDLRDVSESNPEVFADLQKSLVTLLEKGAKWDRAFVYSVQSEEQREQLKVLGYVQ